MVSDVSHEPNCRRGNWSYRRQMMDLNLREVLKGSREALLVMQQIEEALRHGFSVEPGSFLHDEVTRLCSGGPKR